MRSTSLTFLTLSVIVATNVGVGSACGQGADWGQSREIAPNDSLAEDLFGSDVAVSGEVAIAGAQHQSDNGEWSGSAYLFDVVTGAELHELNADDAEEEDHFGAVDISGGVAIVGAYLEDGDGLRWGAAYLFDVTTGAQLHKLVAEDPGLTDNFGWAVAISGGVAIVGSYRDDDGGHDSGAAYLFDVATGAQLHKLTADDAAAEDWFGESVAIANGVALIGAPGDADAGANTGSAYVFDVATGAQLHKLVAEDAEGGDWCGDDVSASGTVAVVGAAGSLETDPGAAYVFDIASGKQLRTLTAGDGVPVDWFGVSVAVSGGIVAIGAPLHDGFSGAVYLFDVASGQLLRKLNGSEQGEAFGFGWGVGLSGGTVVAGRPADAEGEVGGRAYVFGLGPKACPSDGNGDGLVDFTDLLDLLATWGPCG